MECRKVDDTSRLWKSIVHYRRAREYQKGKLNDITRQFRVLVCSLKGFRVWESGWADEQMSTNVGKDHGIQISQKIWKRKVLEEPVLLQKVASEFVSLKNIIIDSNNSSSIMNAAFLLSLSFIHTLL